MTDINVRKLDPQNITDVDIEHVRSLLLQARWSDTAELLNEELLTEMTHKNEMFVAHVSGAIIGMVLLIIEDGVPPGRVGVIKYLSVSKLYYTDDAVFILFAAAVNRARELGVNKVEASIRLDNDTENRALAALGFSSRHNNHHCWHRD